MTAVGRYGGLATIRSARPVPSAESRSDSTTVTRAASPSAVTLARASPAAAGETSSATTRASARSEAIAHAMHPVPVPTSITSGGVRGSQASAHSTRISVSGRGTMAAAPTRTVRSRKAWVPTMCCSGSRRSRRRSASA